MEKCVLRFFFKNCDCGKMCFLVLMGKCSFAVLTKNVFAILVENFIFIILMEKCAFTVSTEKKMMRDM